MEAKLQAAKRKRAAALRALKEADEEIASLEAERAQKAARVEVEGGGAPGKRRAR